MTRPVPFPVEVLPKFHQIAAVLLYQFCARRVIGRWSPEVVCRLVSPLGRWDDVTDVGSCKARRVAVGGRRNSLSHHLAPAQSHLPPPPGCPSLSPLTRVPQCRMLRNGRVPYFCNVDVDFVIVYCRLSNSRNCQCNVTFPISKDLMSHVDIKK